MAEREQSGVARAALRLGGALCMPRGTARAMRADEGARDGTVVVVLYLLGSQVVRLVEGLAGLAAMRNVSGILGLLSALAWALIPILLLSFVVEGILGSRRRRFRGLAMVPLVLIASLEAIGARWGVALPGPDYVAEGVAAAWSVAIAFVVRRSVAEGPESKGEAETSAAMEPVGDTPVPAPAASALVAGLLVVVVVASGGLAVSRAAERWERMGPVGSEEPLPTFSQPTADGERLANEDLEGQVTLLTFWASWCGVCHAEMPVIAQLEQRHRDRGLKVYGVNVDREGDQAQIVADYVERKSLVFPMVLDQGAMRTAFRVTLIPHIVLVDRNGRIRHVHQGRVRSAVLDREIRGLLDETGPES